MILRDLALIFAFTLMMFDSLGQKIHPYDMYSDHFVIERYTKQYDRTFDSVGIILQKNHYHPLTISIYGIMCHDQFVRTGDSTYLTEVKNQYIYFRIMNSYSIYDDLFSYYVFFILNIKNY